MRMLGTLASLQKRKVCHPRLGWEERETTGLGRKGDAWTQGKAKDDDGNTGREGGTGASPITLH